MDAVFTDPKNLNKIDNNSSKIGTPEKKEIIFNGFTPLKNLNIPSPSNRPFRVSIEGNIGAGKSTLINYFSTFPNIETYPEPIEWWRNLDGHNLLDLLYTDINKWHNTFQTYVQLTRLKIQTSKPKSNTTVQIFERSVQNNRFCFVEQAFRNGYLHRADYAILNEWYRWIRENMDITLDLIVYLRSSPEVVYERTKTRGRPEETGITLKYLKQLHESHEKWLMEYNERFNTTPVLVLDADKTLEEVAEQYKSYETKILGYERKGVQKIPQESKDKVRKVLNLTF